MVKDAEHRVEIYACLYALLTEGDEEKFLSNLDTFKSFWAMKEPRFTDYFMQTYHNRKGMTYNYRI